MARNGVVEAKLSAWQEKCPWIFPHSAAGQRGDESLLGLIAVPLVGELAHPQLFDAYQRLPDTSLARRLP